MYEKIYRGKVKEIDYTDVQLIVNDLLTDFSKEKIINYTNQSQNVK